MWYDDTCPQSFLDNVYGVTMLHQYYDILKPTLSGSSPWNVSFPERFGVSDMVIPTSPTRFCSINHAGSDYRKIEKHECFCCNNDASSWSSYPTANNHWEPESQKTPKEIEEPTLKIGRYSIEERKDKITRYVKKRNQRNFNKTIKYECRKTLADKRIRVRGRFAKNNNDHHHDHDHHQPCDQDLVLPNMNNATNSPSEENILYTNSLMKQDYDADEEWLQEAMASLLYSPQIN
ncbi:uncharacterized protein [Rutidosis leptorrhynchoides]|uniref:uncharacterized protein n=1 Tax=Rutidosis leptorrhynchoides TaxID=125765 RepID=UPI003A995326